MTIPIHWYVVYGCFCTTVAELSSHIRDQMAFKANNINCLAMYRKKSAEFCSIF